MRHHTCRFLWRIAAFLSAGCPALVHAGEPSPSWVFFADRGREGEALAAAIDERASELSPRALDRRKRVRGDRGLDARDLAPAPAQVAAVLGTGARLRSSSRWLNAISVEADDAMLAAISVLPAVAYLQPVARRKRAAPAIPRSGARSGLTAASDGAAGDPEYGVAREQLDLLHIPSLHACGLTGAGVVVGIQDSGFSLQHAALMGVHVRGAHDFINDDDIVADEPGDPKGQHNHGTMMLSLLAGHDPGNYMGAAPGISVLLAKTEDSTVEAPFEEDRFVEGLEWIESMGADLFTSSLGYVDWYTPEQFDGKTAVTTKAAVVAVEQGLIMFSSVGNAGPDPMTLIAPSDADGLIAVGAVDLAGVVAEFSSRGPTADGRIKPDIAAPGQDIWLADPNSQTEYGRGDGTSIATPLAAGAAALLLEAFPTLDPATMRALLRQSSSLAATPNNDLGWGLLDASLALAGVDADMDGVPRCAGDCDDGDPAVAPGQPEVCDDGRDNDCNQRSDADDPACADDEPSSTGEIFATGDPDPGLTDGSASSIGDPGGAVGEDANDGCACTAGRTGWTTALLLPGLLLLLCRRRRRRGFMVWRSDAQALVRSSPRSLSVHGLRRE